MVSLSEDDIILEAPGSAILMGAKIRNRPHRDYLMRQQGLFSGKTEGDLDSIPGYYGGTASIRFVQNAKAVNQHRVLRYLKTKAEQQSTLHLPPTLAPSAKRIEAYKNAKSLLNSKKLLKGPARGPLLKEHGPYGAKKGAPKPLVKKQEPKGWMKDAEGNWVYRPLPGAKPAAAAAAAAAAQ